MDNIELSIIKYFLIYDNYIKYNIYIEKDFLKNNQKEIYKLYQVVSLFHKEHPEQVISVLDLSLYFFSQYPGLRQNEKEAFQTIFSRIEVLTVSDERIVEYFEAHQRQARASEIAFAALEVSEGKRKIESLFELIASTPRMENRETSSPFITDNIEELYAENFKESGLRWSLSTLNRSLGSLRRGDFGFLFARPETGKTTFLSSQVVHFAEQIDGCVLWINNEEQSSKVITRCYQSAFGISTQELFSNLSKYKELWQSQLANKIKIVKDEEATFKKDIEQLCAQYKPKLIIFDQLDKVKGFAEDRNDLELKVIYQWARELAKKYGPVIAVCQAGGSGEGKMWLSMSDVDSSKTAKQGEADWMLGIGKSHDQGFENMRGFHILKNKLIGDADTDPTMRHCKRYCIIHPEIGRYEDTKE